MMNYEKPIVLANEDVAEGVYAASGAAEETSSDCWKVDVTMDQQDAGGYSTYRVKAKHSDGVTHISSKTVVTVVFNGSVSAAEFEGSAEVSGNTVTLTRESHANAYYSGDNYDSLLKIWPKGLAVTSSGIVCTHVVNVQGGFD
ncbi:MAG: hypothetical protein NC517_01060 [Firmicutes bacterium]|nr:hypothetical protein [Bacillota bacterium]